MSQQPAHNMLLCPPPSFLSFLALYLRFSFSACVTVSFLLLCRCLLILTFFDSRENPQGHIGFDYINSSQTKSLSLIHLAGPETVPGEWVE